MIDKYAHTIPNKKQTILNHLEGVAKQSSLYANDIIYDCAYLVGLAHDIGKYADDFQNRLNGSKKKFEHSVCGAIELGKLPKTYEEKFMTYMLQYCIAGHHTGLPDGGSLVDSSTETTLIAKLKRSKNYINSADYSSYKNEINLRLPDYAKLNNVLLNSKDEIDWIEQYAFFTRYLFSCLTDADYIDTERFCKPCINRQLSADFKIAENIVNDRLKSFKCVTNLQKTRNRLQQQAINNIDNNSHIHIVDMPTGSGKTLCSIKLALKLLNKYGRKRIIYVIPYTTIIEQTANEFEKLFGNVIDIVQHHSNYCYDNDEENNTAEKLKRSTENWDAPIIITTNVQFFQSLYHYRSSKLRKLHNLADSIIVFDEIHTLPIEYLQPCLRAIGYITKYLNSDVLFLSATMPNYSELFEKYVDTNAYSELITDKSDFKYFQKCKYSYIGTTTMISIATNLNPKESNLIIVNSREKARELYQFLQGKKYHLSTYMTPNDRSKTVKQIRKDLANNIPINVVSTSLVEAGVDFDFDNVYRELAGLDNILQSGGRCNREGKKEFGNVYIFKLDGKVDPEIRRRSHIVSNMLEKNKDITSDECIKDYYNELFKLKTVDINTNTIANNTFISKKSDAFISIPFRTYANSFEFIRDDTISVVINNCKESSILLSQLSNDRKATLQKLQKYSISLRFKELNDLLDVNKVDNSTYGIYVLTDNKLYDAEVGLNINILNLLS